MSRTRAALLLAALLGAGCAHRGVELAGRVVQDGRPVAGARVTLVSEAGRPALAGTDADGVYRFPSLAPGSYRATVAGGAQGSLVGAGGETTLVLAPGAPVWTGFQLVPRGEVEFVPYAAATPGFGALSGLALLQGAPVEGAVASLYLDRGEELRGPGFRQSVPTGPDGRFSIEDLPEGSYWVAVRKRRSGAVGPVREGDLYGVASASPVSVPAGREARLVVHLARKAKERAPRASELARTGTAIRGRVVDGAGRPAAGVYVFAYRERVIGHTMPDFLSEPTGPDGTFLLPLGDGGLFYIGARELFGGSPRPGERFGQYEGSPDHGIRVGRGAALAGVEIVVHEVLAQ
jgi:hypothetical protein